MSDNIKINEEYLEKLKTNLNIETVNKIKTELFGKNGQISNSFKNLGSLPTDERKKFASDLNAVKEELQNIINIKIQEIEIKENTISYIDNLTATLNPARTSAEKIKSNFFVHSSSKQVKK